MAHPVSQSMEVNPPPQELLTLFRHSALATEMDCREKDETKLSFEKYSGVLVFEVLAFDVLAFEVLVFEILVFEVLDLRS